MSYIEKHHMSAQVQIDSMTARNGTVHGYSFDAVGQLMDYQQGTLAGAVTRTQSWDLDPLGNWSTVTTDGMDQIRTHNAQNEITGIGEAASLTYDGNGNLTTDENEFQFRWDAWNRLVQVRDASDAVVATYGRDALGRRITVEQGETVTDRYFSSEWQLLEEKVGEDTVTRNIWSPVYVDALVLRDRDTDGNGTLDERLYPLQDANWNVMALVKPAGTVVERYSYDPYGQATVRDASGDVIAGSAKAWVFLHQGGEQITAGDYDFRNRAYSPSLGRWLSNDPIGFEAGDNNWYRYEGSSPGNRVDPEGLIWWPGKYLYQMYQEYDRGNKLDSQINNLPINLDKPAVGTTPHWINNLNSAIISGVWDGAIMTIDGMSFGLVVSDSLTNSLYKEYGNHSFCAGNVASGALTFAGGVWIYQSYTGSTLLVESKYLTGKSGGIFQIRPDGKAPWFRLDFHPLRGGGKPIIHIDSSPLNWHHWPWK